ncbi:response regulator [Treponema pedis]|uniref:histidine kinase n=1 Tax=Treponema pedis str. T A4 TaxID=1291379 RepID=S6A810_9SPIR|nr:response regulator [Treponema pedis]AGT43019.1 sensor histidine kinase/response regulator [Treponema pedis str. T A4]
MGIFKKSISHGKLGKYLENSNSAYIIFSKDRLPIFWNESAENLLPNYLSLEPKIRFDEYLIKTISPAEYERVKIFLKNYVKKCSFEIEFESPANSNEKLNLKIDAVEQEDGNFFVTVDDITKQKVKEKFLINEKHDVENANKMRSLFLATVSHEIRTPIQTIIGMMELIDGTNLDEEQREYTRQVNFSAEVLLALVNDVLDFSKLESGNMSIESITFNLPDSIEQTVDLIAMEANKKGLEVLIDIDTELPEFIIGDPHRLRQVLLNFAKNAVKFTEHGSILVSVRQIHETVQSDDGESKKSFILCEVADTGIGVSDEQKDKIFNSFYQGNAAINRKYGGTGLGLAISKNIVTMMKGEIGLRDNFQEGSVFWFKIPLVPSIKKAPQENILLDKTTRFLIVDDNLHTRSVIKRMLSKFGFGDISMVSSGKQAIEIMQAAQKNGSPFEIVFIDMIMPEMDGWRLGAEIHNDAALKDSKLYLMIPEGSLGGDAKMKLLEWFEGYLYKPLKRRLVFNLLNDIYRKSHDVLTANDIHELEPLEEGASASFRADDDNLNAPKKLKQNFKILVVDDHTVNLNLLKILLEKSGYDVTTAENGQEAINMASKTEFDIIFMDIQMPILNGYEATQILRQSGYSLPIVACTAGSQEDERKLCLSMGMDDIIAKPFNKQQLLDMVERYRQ